MNAYGRRDVAPEPNARRVLLAHWVSRGCAPGHPV